MKELISHPIDVIKAVAADKYEKWSNVLDGGGTKIKTVMKDANGKYKVKTVGRAG